jgi:hypothetical protein
MKCSQPIALIVLTQECYAQQNVSLVHRVLLLQQNLNTRVLGFPMDLEPYMAFSADWSFSCPSARQVSNHLRLPIRPCF